MFAQFFGFLFLLAVLLGVIFYAFGWLKIQSRESVMTIVMKTGEMKNAVNAAIDRSRTLIRKGDEQLKRLGGSDFPRPKESDQMSVREAVKEIGRRL